MVVPSPTRTVRNGVLLVIKGGVEGGLAKLLLYPGVLFSGHRRDMYLHIIIALYFVFGPERDMYLHIILALYLWLPVIVFVVFVYYKSQISFLEAVCLFINGWLLENPGKIKNYIWQYLRYFLEK